LGAKMVMKTSGKRREVRHERERERERSDKRERQEAQKSTWKLGAYNWSEIVRSAWRPFQLVVG